MPMPTWEDAALTVLRAIKDGRAWRYSDLVDIVSREFGLTPDEHAELIPSGRPRIYDRTYWATQALATAGLANRPQRGVVVITDDGLKLLEHPPSKITSEFLTVSYPGYAEFRDRARGSRRAPISQRSSNGSSALTPLEEVDQATTDLRISVEVLLLQRLKAGSWQFFQNAVLAVLKGIGYGWDDDAAKPGTMGPDGGVDGEIREDALGLEMIYIQAKRYTERNVPVPDIDRFIGALTRKRSRKGVFITTSDFSQEALAQAERVEGKRVILINGAQFVDLMIKHGIGVVERPSPKIYDLDENFFAEDPA